MLFLFSLLVSLVCSPAIASDKKMAGRWAFQNGFITDRVHVNGARCLDARHPDKLYNSAYNDSFLPCCNRPVSLCPPTVIFGGGECMQYCGTRGVCAKNVDHGALQLSSDPQLEMISKCGMYKIKLANNNQREGRNQQLFVYVYQWKTANKRD